MLVLAVVVVIQVISRLVDNGPNESLHSLDCRQHRYGMYELVKMQYEYIIGRNLYGVVAVRQDYRYC